jgi:uncharacterized protein (UPF0303 family)
MSNQVETLREQEQNLQFEKFDEATAWEIGC